MSDLREYFNAVLGYDLHIVPASDGVPIVLFFIVISNGFFTFLMCAGLIRCFMLYPKSKTTKY